MERLHYRQVLKNLKDNGLLSEGDYNFIITIDDTNYDKVLQQILVEYGQNIAVDGYIGIQTVNAYMRVDRKKIQEEFYRRVNIDEDKLTPNELLYKHLAKWESTKIHFNKTEKGFTTPLGIYSIYHPRAEAVKYVKELANQYGLDYRNRYDIRKLNLKITDEERKHLIELALDYLTKTFGDNRVKAIMVDKDMDKPYVAYMSISINANTKMGNKCLQYGLELKDDGIVGPKTLSALKIISNNNYHKLLVGMVDRIKRFHKFLANAHPSKYGIYLRGWFRRDDSLLK